MKDLVLFVEAEKTFKRIREEMNKSLKPHSVTFDQWIVMEQIFKREGINQKSIATETGKDEASVSRIIAKLKKSELVFSKKSESNKKFLNLYLSPKGIDLSNVVTEIISHKFHQKFNKLEETEIENFSSALKKLC